MDDLQYRAYRRELLMTANDSEYGDVGRELQWITPSKAGEAEKIREATLKTMGEGLNWMFSQTKAYTGALSPGCLLCGQGSWSCLFINGKCNCRCFYCPTSQDDESVPTTNRLSFTRATDYSDYVRDFGFKGVSISGGEPLLTFDKTLKFIQTVRQNNGDGLHIWMYTNGTLLTEDHVLKLKDAGLSEIRFDLSARDYDLERLRLAVGHIPVVTVEIPAIPEDRQILANLIPVMHDSGVNHLNLHQMRLTPHNSRFLKSRDYTFVHGEKVTVLESELTALSILGQALSENWKLPINYCAFAYKNQFQRAASRKRNACFIIKPHESLTESGYIRSLALCGDSRILGENAGRLMAEDPGKTLWQQTTGSSSRILFHEDLFSLLDFKGCDLAVAYSEAVVSPGLSYHNPFKEIRLNLGKKIYVEKQGRKKDLILNDKQIQWFGCAVLGRAEGCEQSSDEITGECSGYEFIQKGLQEYF